MACLGDRRSAYVLLCCGLVLSCGVGALAQSVIITIDAPGAGVSQGQGTGAAAIDASGAITGSFYDSNFACHGYVRKPDGAYITFDTPLGQHGIVTCPRPASINAAGVITGVEFDPSFGCSNWPDTTGGCGGSHGFVRHPNGAMIVFDGPIDPSRSNPGTDPAYINAHGAVVGRYWIADQGSASASFLRSAGGTFITFDAPGTNNRAAPGAVGINASGTIVGNFNDSNSNLHGYLRASDGTFMIIDAPGAVRGTRVDGISSRGELAGLFWDTNTSHGYVRARNGTFTTFDVPEACAGSIRVVALSDKGTVAGTFLTPAGGGFFAQHGFLRAADGAITTFDVPGAVNVIFGHVLPFTGVSGINSSDAVVGSYLDANGIGHGYLRLATDPGDQE
jgi:hypothetical protein